MTGARTGRRAGDSGTRASILAAARDEFASHGYTGATIRAIAAAAAVDPALVHHYYGTKERLFAAAMELPVVPSEVLAAAIGSGKPGASLGTLLVRTALTIWQLPQAQATIAGLLRSAVTSERAAVMFREFLTDAILGTVGQAAGLDALGAGEAGFRAGLVASQMAGLALTRHVLVFPAVGAASVEDLAAAIGPTIDRYLTGEITDPERIGSKPP